MYFCVCIFKIAKLYFIIATHGYHINPYTKGLILQSKFNGSSTDDPARDRSARVLACIKVRLSLPYFQIIIININI